MQDLPKSVVHRGAVRQLKFLRLSPVRYDKEQAEKLCARNGMSVVVFFCFCTHGRVLGIA